MNELTGSEQDPIPGSCELPSSIKDGQFLEQMSDYLLLKETAEIHYVE
jgi:hypothetical protein